MEGKLMMNQNEPQACDQATESCLHVDAGQRVMLVTCLLPLLVQLVDEEGVEEVALWVAFELAHLHITLLQVIAEMSLHACGNCLHACELINTIPNTCVGLCSACRLPILGQQQTCHQHNSITTCSVRLYPSTPCFNATVNQQDHNQQTEHLS